MRAKSGRSGVVSAFLLGVASLLIVEAVAGAAILGWPQTVVAGTALPGVPVLSTAPAPTETAAPPTGETPQTNPPEGVPSEPTAPATRAASAPAAAVPGQRPGTIRLPNGGTATLVRKEIVGPNSELPVPENLGEATWWGAGLDAPHGASVFAGHVNWGGTTGPFAELWDAKINGEVTVLDSAGKPWRYHISQVITLHKDELPQRADELFGQQGTHRIVLVTCGGRWLGGSTGYAENRVVIADPR